MFARSLAPDDWVALAVTGNVWAIARILEGHVARVIVVSPTDTVIRQARAKTDRSTPARWPSCCGPASSTACGRPTSASA